MSEEEEEKDLLHAWYLSSLESEAALERKQKAKAASLVEEARLAAIEKEKVRRKLCCMVPLFNEQRLRRFLLSVRDQPSAMTLMRMRHCFLKQCVVQFDTSTCFQHWLQRANLNDYGHAYKSAMGKEWECSMWIPTIYALQLMAAHLSAVYSRHGPLALQGMPPAWYVFGKSNALTHAQDSAMWILIDRKRARAEACAFLGAVYAVCSTHLNADLCAHVLDALLFCEPVAPIAAIHAVHAVHAVDAVDAVDAGYPR
jgi:hypothetical protein